MPTAEPSAPLLAESARLTLRRLTASDLDWVCALEADPEVMRFITGGVPTPRETVAQVYLPRMLRSYPQGPQYGFHAATLRASGRIFGWFHLRPERQEPFAMELGYRLSREAWGRGLATEGSIALLGRSFRDWNLPRVVAHTLATNLASRRVMEKSGLRWERDFIAPAEWHPGWSEEQRRAVRYCLEAADFFVRHPAVPR